MTARPRKRILDGTITNPDQARQMMVTLARQISRPVWATADVEQMAALVLWMDLHLSHGGALPTQWAEDGTVNHGRPVTDVRAQPSGQATYEAFTRVFSDGHDEPWASLDEDERGRWADVAAASPHPPAPDLVLKKAGELHRALAAAWLRAWGETAAQALTAAANTDDAHVNELDACPHCTGPDYTVPGVLCPLHQAGRHRADTYRRARAAIPPTHS